MFKGASMDMGLLRALSFKKITHPLDCTNKATNKANLPHENPILSRNDAHQGTFEISSHNKIVTLSDDTSSDLINIRNFKDVEMSHLQSTLKAILGILL